MPFPTRQAMSAQAFKQEIIDQYWPNLAKDLATNASLKSIVNRGELPNDYAEIGSFLTDPGRVERYLVPLEREIRAQIVLQAQMHPTLVLPKDADELKPLATSRKHGGGANLKSHKVLTNALRKFESETGFNHEKIQNGTYFDDAKQGTLFSTAGRSDNKGKLTRVTEKVLEGQTLREPVPKELQQVDLPKGAPTVIGDLDALAFNPLLRHGYQFKDVGAGAYHGEFTHRLQWYAITTAASEGNIGLRNTPLEIYRSMGFAIAKAPDTDHGGVIDKDSPQQLWVWQALFDTAENDQRAVALKTLACQGGLAVYTCPESLNKALFSALYLEGTQYDEKNPSNLWCLRVLLATRWKKRFDESEGLVNYPSGLKKLQERMDQKRTTEVVSSVSMTKEMKTFKEVSVKKSVFGPLYIGPTGTLIRDKQEIVEIKRFETGATIERHETPTIGHAGYALAWYLRDDRVN